jgi:hypothetical protein
MFPIGITRTFRIAPEKANMMTNNSITHINGMTKIKKSLWKYSLETSIIHKKKNRRMKQKKGCFCKCYRKEKTKKI